MNDSNMRIGRRVRELRLAAGLSQRGLSRLVGISQQHLMRCETGRQELKASTLWRICSVVDTDLSEFFGR